MFPTQSEAADDERRVGAAAQHDGSGAGFGAPGLRPLHET
jgi:hypothetical protein